MTVEDRTPDLLTRIWFAWVCSFRVLFDAAFAARVWSVRDRMPALNAAPARDDEDETRVQADEVADEKRIEKARADGEAKGEAKGLAKGEAKGRVDGALSLLGLLQTEGRFVDFLQQDIASFDDADVGTAARVVHEGCRRALKDRMTIEAIAKGTEGSTIVLEKGFDRHETKLVGDVPADGAKVEGKLRHKGWRAKGVKLPEPTKGHTPEILCPAEVEL